MPLTYTPLRYPGGKSKYSGLFNTIIEQNKLNNCTFVEVFAGGAGAAIALLRKGLVKSLILNDLDISIYAFWKSITENPNEFIQKIKSTRINMTEWKRQKLIFDQKNKSDLFSLGFASFYMNRCNHSGILNARPIGGIKQKGPYRINARFNKTTSIKKIKAIAKHASTIQVFNLDGETLLRKLKQMHKGKNLLIYLDPPYRQKGPALYMNHFHFKEHRSLRNEIMKCKFPWVLSYDNHKDIIDLYQDQDCTMYLKTIRHTISGNFAADELIISKLDLPNNLKKIKSCTRSCA